MIMNRNSKQAEEVYFSEKILKARTDYHVVIRSQQEDIGDLHKVSLFVNGFDDMQTSIRYYTPFENAQVVVG